MDVFGIGADFLPPSEKRAEYSLGSMARFLERREKRMTILVSGGAGYIGTHTCVELLQRDYKVIILDNLYNSSEKAVERIREITGKVVKFYRVDMRDKEGVERVFQENPDISALIHFAGLKAVGESVRKPMEYYETNIGGLLNLTDAMQRHGCRNIIFSSSATVYGDPAEIPITESCPKGLCTNPYGWTKWMQEQILTDIHTADPEWNVILLRYFNPIGAHRSGLIGEDPKGIPNNLLPYVSQVAIGRLPKIQVFGADYPTPDGSGVRDYIHVVDLARGHVHALERLKKKDGVFVCNLGTGRGYSVFEVIRAFEKACGKELPYEIKPRREGDIAVCYSSPEKALRELGWKAEFDLDAMCRDSWNWQKKNPNGYQDPKKD